MAFRELRTRGRDMWPPSGHLAPPTAAGDRHRRIPMPKAVTKNLEVSVDSFFLEDQSDSENNVFAFAYRVRLRNRGDRTVQLISRHWIITDSSGKVSHVKGEGVVGQQPVLAPGGDYEYVSGSRLESPLGTMHGTYQMRTESGEMFDAEIPVFTLSANRLMN
jgi:ApaG protein